MKVFTYKGEPRSEGRFGLIQTNQKLELTEAEALSVAGNPEFVPVTKRGAAGSAREKVALAGTPFYDLRTIPWDSPKLGKWLLERRKQTLMNIAEAMVHVGCDIFISEHDNASDIADTVHAEATANGWHLLDEKERAALGSVESATALVPPGIRVGDTVRLAAAGADGQCMNVAMLEHGVAYVQWGPQDDLNDATYPVDALVKAEESGEQEEGEETPPQNVTPFTGNADGRTASEPTVTFRSLGELADESPKSKAGKKAIAVIEAECTRVGVDPNVVELWADLGGILDGEEFEEPAPDGEPDGEDAATGTGEETTSEEAEGGETGTEETETGGDEGNVSDDDASGESTQSDEQS